MSSEEELDLSGNKQWHSAIAHLSVARLKNLRVLNLSHCDVRELPAELNTMSDLN